jgi:hypothetical protein
MLILTPENKPYNLDSLPSEIEDIRYSVFDVLNTDPDFYFPPLVFIEQFNCPSALLEIGNFKIQMPLDWSVVVVDEELTSGEIMPITSLNDRDFHTITYNPLSQMIPNTATIKIANVFNDVKWFFPKLKTGSLLVIPLEMKDKPQCALFIQDKTKIQNIFDIHLLFG